MRSHSRRRRGVLLLVVLGLLTMFAMIGLTFVVLTGQARRIAEVGQSVEVQYVPPQSDLDRAMAQVARGSTSPMSAIGPHSLLEDMYGSNYQQGALRSISDVMTVPSANGAILELTTAIANPERYAGSVLTMLNGPAAGTSARIIAYLPPTNRPARFQVLSTEGMDYTSLTNYLRTYGAITYVVNSMPFSGKGFGSYNNGQLSDDALRPGVHRYGYWPNGGTGTSAGEANEDYDAPDYQNMLLAVVKGPTYPTGAASVNEDTIRVPIPSLHRPDLVNYWVNTRRSIDAASAMRYILRPLRGTPDDVNNVSIHRGFTGSNPATFNPRWNGTYADGGGRYAWDVDNDGDGVADSIWVDLGMQVRSTADGRLYKPLFAILCTDLDGRINLNAHGLPAQLSANYYANATTNLTWQANANLRAATAASFASGMILPNLLFPNAANFTGTTALPLGRGLGCGPSEINPRALFDSVTPNSTAVPNEIVWLFRGRNMALGAFEGRYGETVAGTNALPGLTNFRPGYQNVGYTLLNNRDYPYAKNYYGLPYDTYSTPPDLDGDCALALDVAGRPVYWGMGETQPAATAANPGGTSYASGNYTRNTPYELNLNRTSAWRRDIDQARSVDNPFTPAELERVLRAYDVDATSLSPRLLALTADATGNPANSLLLRRAAEITTESWDLPCPPVVIPPEVRQQYGLTGPAYHLMYLLQLKSGRTGAQLVSLARQLLAPEWLNGLRMDLNRPFGNGRDDNGNGVVDEGGETEYLSYPGAPRVLCDPSNGRTGGVTAAQARLFYARNLYCLALLLLDVENTLDKDRTVGKNAARKRLAQWAVNVVDFYDRDSTMTRFSYIVDPFTNSWPSNPNDQAFTDPSRGGFVWGVERPELLLTETLALHDRRTTDTDEDEPDKKKVADGDDAFDQKLRPQGSLFLELYNPWSPDEVPSADIHRTKPRATHPVTAAVNLAQKTPTVTGTRSDPVWQILITNFSVDPQTLDSPGSLETPPQADRVVYFTDPGELPAEADATARVRYFPYVKTEAAFKYVAPGEYAVVGPGDRDEALVSQTFLGFGTGKDQGENSTRQIVLDLDATGKLPGVRVLNNNRDTPDTEKVIRPPLPFIINRSEPVRRDKEPQRLSISEPIGGYEEDASNAPAYSSGRYVYAPVVNNSVDYLRADDKLMKQAILDNGSRSPMRRIHLRRLANPLKPYFNDPRRLDEQNIYITIDSMPVDLTAFNGADLWNEKELPGDIAKKPEPMDSRERGEHARAQGIDPYDIWSQEPYDSLNEPSAFGAPAPPQDHNYDKGFTHTLGFLNSRFGDLTAPPAPPVRAAVHLGDPPRPFPWFNWNNRPFFSAYELMFVPWNNSADLLNPEHFGQTPVQNYYNASSNLNANTWPYRHLQNYFQSQAFPSSSAVTRFPQFFRLLDMVEVPSRFAGTRTQLDPATMAGTGNLEHYFRPPFNWVSAYREPGRVNINTVYNYDVFRAVMNYCGAAVNNPALPQSEMLLLWDRLVRSRRGDAITGGGSTTPTNTFLATVTQRMLQTNNASPARWGNPFRSYAGGHLRHSTQQQQMNSMQLGGEVHATLLRADPDSRSRPLFEYRSTQPHEESNRNPFFRYRQLERLGNVVTTRSNVYAVWITVGYFEVRRVNNQQYFPDGHELGQELGIDTGEVQRHRAFYIFDRSIPMGFIRGQDLNFEKGLVLRRFIE